MDDIVYVDPTTLRPHPDRTKAGTMLSEEDGKYKLLALSIREEGIQDPLKIQKGTDNIIGGHHRWKIAVAMGMKEVPARYYDVDDDEARLMMVMDNHKRIGDEKDPMKLAWTFQVVVSENGATRGGARGGDLKNKQTLEELAQFFGMKRRHFINYLSLLHLIPELQRLVSEQKIGIKAGSILSKLSPQNQRKVYESIPNSRKPDWRMTEAEARNLANVYEPKLQVVEVVDDDEVSIESRSAAVENGIATLDVDIEDLDLGYEDDAYEEGVTTTSDIVDNLEQGGTRKYHDIDQMEIGLAANQFIDRPNRKSVLNVSEGVDIEYGEKGLAASKMVEESAKEMAQQIVLIEGVDKRVEYAKTQLSVAIDKQLKWIERIDAELIPMRVLVGDELDEQLGQRWNELCEQVERVQKKIRAMSEVIVRA